MKATFSLPIRLPGTNEITQKDRSHWATGAKFRKKTIADVAQLLGTRVRFDSPVAIEFEWFEPNAKRDIDNVTAGAKFVLDALVGRGFLAGDGQKDVVALSHRFHVDAAKPRVEVTVYEVNPA